MYLEEMTLGVIKQLVCHSYQNSYTLLIHSTAPCPKCDHPMAHFMELQIRSADEPMTICTCLPIYPFLLSNFVCSSVFKCANKECGFQWKEN